MSSYVQSRTDEIFEISIEPRFPWLNQSRDRSLAREAPACDRSSCQKPSCGPGEHGKRQVCSPQNNMFSRSLASVAPEYSLLVKVHFDGREYPERRSLISLDMGDPDFSPRGKILKNSWVENGNGTLTEHLWVFHEKGIENVLGRLRLSATTAGDDEEEEDTLSKTMASADIAAPDGDASPGDGKAGQIVVTVNKVLLGQQYFETSERKATNGTPDDLDMEDTDPNITHTTGRLPKKNIFHGPKRCQAILPYQDDDRPFATFVFFYRSSETLENMGFTRRSSTRNTRAMNLQLASLTPLSFLDSKASTKDKPQDTAFSYEEKIRTCSFKPDLPKLDFGQQYRGNPSPAGQRKSSKTSKVSIILPSIEEDESSDLHRGKDPASPETSSVDKVTCRQEVWNQQSFKAPKLRNIIASLDAKVDAKGSWKAESGRRSPRTSQIDQISSTSKAHGNLHNYDADEYQRRQADWASHGPRRSRDEEKLGRDDKDNEDRHRSRRLRTTKDVDPTPTQPIGSFSQGPSPKLDEKQDSVDLTNSVADGDNSQGSVSINSDSCDETLTESEPDFDEDGSDKGKAIIAVNVEEEGETHVGLRKRLGDIDIKKRSREMVEDADQGVHDQRPGPSPNKKRQGS